MNSGHHHSAGGLAASTSPGKAARALPSSTQRQHPLFQCHLCSYSGSSRHHYNQHLSTHYNYQCTKCGFVAGSEENLKAHRKAEHQQTQHGSYLEIWK
jgi:hypothetical protein